MEKKVLSPIYVLFLTVLLLLSILQVIQASVDPDSFPRLDDCYFYECEDEDDMIDKGTGGIVDVAKDLRNPDNVDLMNTTYGWTIVQTPTYPIHVTLFNCRDVYPETAGTWDYHGRQPGDSNFPLNVSAFRFALKILISPPKMNEWVYERFDWTEVPLDTIVTPAHGIWYNPNVPVETYNTTKALEVLNNAGFYNDSAHTGLPDGYWANTNPTIGPVGELRHIHVMGYIPGAIPQAAWIWWREWESWDAFFGTASDGQPYFIDESLMWTFSDWLCIAHHDRTFDITFEYLVLGETLEYLYDFFHPDMDYPWTGGWFMMPDHNTVGLDDPEVNDMEYAVKYWRWPNGTYITSIDEMQNIVWDLQELLYYLQPCAVTYQSVRVDAYHLDLEGMINSPGYGSDNWWTYNWLMWTDPAKTNVNIGLPFTIDTLNPGWADGRSDSAWGILDRLYEGLWMVEPSDLHRDVMWGCTNWTWEPWSDPSIGVQYGQKVRFYIRLGIYWHDGTPYTAEDAAFSFRTIEKLQLAQYADVLSTYVYSDIVDRYTIDVYMNCTGLWSVYAYTRSAMIFNEAVWKPLWNKPAEAEAFTPWNITYDDWTGSSGHGDLTCLVGTGPYIFLSWDRLAGVCHLTANRPGAMWTGNPDYWKTAQVAIMRLSPIMIPALIIFGIISLAMGLSKAWSHYCRDRNHSST